MDQKIGKRVSKTRFQTIFDWGGQYNFNKFNKFGGKANPPNFLNLCWPPPLAKKSVNAFPKRVSRFVGQGPPGLGGFPNFNNLLNLLNLLNLYWPTPLAKKSGNAFPKRVSRFLAKRGGQYKFNKFGGLAFPPNVLNLCWPPQSKIVWKRVFETRFPIFWSKPPPTC